MNGHELSLVGFINEMAEVSFGPHTRKFCFVIGAGASRSSGIKTGQELVNIWENELSIRNPENFIGWKEDLNINEENKYSFYSHFYEKRFNRHPSDGYNYLEKLMEYAKPSSGYVMLAYLLSKTNNNVVITTNFDHLLEDAVNYYIQNIPMVIGHESLTHYIPKKPQRPTILKIHRDLLFDPANKVNDVEKLHNNWKKALDIIFSEYNPIFIGYAGNDNSLMDYLLDNGQRFSNGELCCPYWMLYKNDKLDGKLQRFIELSNGYYIKHSGFDEVLYLMGAAFKYNMPTKDEFFKDAEKRYQTLSDAFDAFAEKKESLNDDMTTNDTNVDNELNQAVKQVTKKSDLQRIYRKALMLDRDGKYDEALILKEKLLSLSPNNARYHNSLGNTLSRLERYDESLDQIQKSIALEPNNSLYYMSYGNILKKVKRYEEAIKVMQKAIELEPSNSNHYNVIADLFQEMENYDDALIMRQKAIENDPDDAEYYDNLGDLLLQMKRYDEAIIESQKAIDIDPDCALYHFTQGMILTELKRYDGALTKINRAVELDPKNAYYLNRLGNTLQKMGRNEEAVEVKKRAVELSLDDAYLHADLGLILKDLDQYEEALKEFKKAIELEPERAFFHHNLGMVLTKLKSYNEAIIDLTIAVELEPENAAYHNNLGMALSELGRFEEALIEINKAYELNPDDSSLKNTIEMNLQLVKKEFNN
jgi:protein O-mannosyl-transferase